MITWIFPIKAMAGVIFQSYLHFWLEFVKIGIFETNLAIKEVTIFVQSCLFVFEAYMSTVCSCVAVALALRI